MKKYRSYLLRVWWEGTTEIEPLSARRFIIETVSDAPRRWSFDSFPELVTFLQEETHPRLSATNPPLSSQETQNSEQENQDEQNSQSSSS
jgi:hypothetical protein